MALKGEPFKKFFGIVKQVAPTVLTAMGQPIGAALLRTALGGKEGDDVEKLVEDASMTPEGIERLRLAEIDLQKFESEKGVKFAELDVADVASARQHDIEMRKQGDRTTTQLAWLLVGAFVALSAAIVVASLLGLSAAESTTVGAIIGYLLGEAKQVTAFYFGSSRGSKSKDAAISGRQ
jgi:hypothetical protein